MSIKKASFPIENISCQSGFDRNLYAAGCRRSYVVIRCCVYMETRVVAGGYEKAATRLVSTDLETSGGFFDDYLIKSTGLLNSLSLNRQYFPLISALLRSALCRLIPQPAPRNPQLATKYQKTENRSQKTDIPASNRSTLCTMPYAPCPLRLYPATRNP